MSIAPHMHIGFAEFIVFFLYFIVASFLVRVLEIWLANNAVGQALAFIH
jgi:hypothetical protein